MKQTKWVRSADPTNSREVFKHSCTRDERRVDQTKVSERREGPQLPQQLVGGVGVAVQDKLLQGASKEELQGARAKEPFA